MWTWLERENFLLEMEDLVAIESNMIWTSYVQADIDNEE